MKIENTGDWVTFITVAKEKSFIKASKALNLAPAVVTKRIVRLEDALKVRLFQRTTRSVQLTDEGRELLPMAERLIADMSEAETLFEKNETISGTIRFTAPATFCQRKLAPIITEFQKLYPDVKLELEMTNSVLNLIERGIDVAIRIGKYPDSSLIARKIGVNDLLVCASPDYLKKSKPIKSAKDLKFHSLLYIDGHRNYRFEKSSLKISDISKSSHIICNDGSVLTALAISGAGIVIRSRWDVDPYIESGDLKCILQNDPLESAGDIFIVAPTRRHQSPRVRAFINFVVENFGR
jgi:LysR family transcriptional activator of dmlA